MPSSVNPGPGSDRSSLTWVAAAFASTLVLVVFAASDSETATPIPVLGASLVAGWAVYTAGSVVASRRLGSGDVRRDLGLSARPIDLPRHC